MRFLLLFPLFFWPGDGRHAALRGDLDVTTFDVLVVTRPESYPVLEY